MIACPGTVAIGDGGSRCQLPPVPHETHPLVIPNGIPRHGLDPLPAVHVARIRDSLKRDLVLTKVARWDPDKRWIMAVETVAALKARGHDSVLIAVGGVDDLVGLIPTSR
jgi:glycosyltransferase involved in cell wall biosynthesis